MVHHTRAAGLSIFLVTALVIGLTVGALAQAVTPAAASQSVAPATAPQAAAVAGKTVWDGVYTAEQAARGSELYRTICAECHSSGEAPSIVGNSFMRRWFDDNLNVPYAYMRRAMPDNAPGTLTDEENASVLSYMLQAGGFPAGSNPLVPETAHLSSIMVLEKDGTVPNFSMVQVVGCMTQDAGGAWTVSNGATPHRARDPLDSAPAVLQAMAGTPLGVQTFELTDVTTARRALAGHKVLAKGILEKTPKGNRLNVTALQSLAASCTE